MSNATNATRIVYHEPDKDGHDVVFAITRESAIRKQRDAVSRSGFVYDSDEQCLADFMAVNWAFEVEVDKVEVSS